jgi:hypothetical protein
MMAGTIEIFPSGETLEKVEPLLNEFVEAVDRVVLESLDTDLADSLTETLKQIIDMLVYKQEKGLDVSIWKQHNKSVFYMLLRILGVYNNFRLLGKAEPEHLINQKKKVMHILNQCRYLIPGISREDAEKENFFESYVTTYF